METLAGTRVVKSRVEPNEHGHPVAIPCCVRAYVLLGNGRTQHFYSGRTEKEAIANAVRDLPGLQYNWKRYD